MRRTLGIILLSALSTLGCKEMGNEKVSRAIPELTPKASKTPIMIEAPAGLYIFEEYKGYKLMVGTTDTSRVVTLIDETIVPNPYFRGYDRREENGTFTPSFHQDIRGNLPGAHPFKDYKSEELVKMWNYAMERRKE
jgi:hypothetical protein